MRKFTAVGWERQALGVVNWFGKLFIASFSKLENLVCLTDIQSVRKTKKSRRGVIFGDFCTAFGGVGVIYDNSLLARLLISARLSIFVPATKAVAVLTLSVRIVTS